jgi:ABC-type antimicrobial peptide transport system permease subunit
MTLGRWFALEEDVQHGPLVAVLSDRFWKSQYQSDPNIIGKTITASGFTFQVIGVAPVQANVLLVNVFPGAALFLSAIGLYGTLVYSVNQRTRELGIRIAMGASSANILRLVMQRGVRLMVIGLTIGILAAIETAR